MSSITFIVGQAKCVSQYKNLKHLPTSFVRKPDDGPVRAETCSLINNKYDVLDVN